MNKAIALFLALFLFLPAIAAQEPAGGSAPEEWTDAEFQAPGNFAGDPGFPMLTEESFAADDLPEGYLEPSKLPGRVEKVRYTVSEGEGGVKSVMVYLPRGYDGSDMRYNVVYLLHASGGKTKNYLDPDKATAFQNLLDHMIADGKTEPLIVAAATYYPAEGFTQFMPLEKQVEVAAAFPEELVRDVIPAVESAYRTYADDTGEEGIRLSRAHRAVAGFSLGGVTAWYVFLRQMQAFRWFLPISEASWDDGEGGTNGIWDSDLSAAVLHDAVLAQGFGRDDFRLYVATGTEDEAFAVSTDQMISLLEYDDLFKPGENTGCSMMIGGTHTITAVYTYIYHILPSLFAE